MAGQGGYEQGRAAETRVGLALGGGSARGLAHIGVLKALDDEGIPVKAVAGTSAGSLVAAAFCAGLPWWTILAGAREINWLDIAAPVLPRMGLLKTEKLQLLLEKAIGDRAFEELAIPLSVVTVDVTTGEKIVLSKGPLAPAVRASCAIPGIFEPVEIDGRHLVDGGLLDNVPVDVARSMGAYPVIGVNLNSSRRHHDPPRHVIDVLLYSFDILRTDGPASLASLADVLVAPDLEEFSPREFRRIDELVERGEGAMRAEMERLKELMQSKASTIDSPGESPNSGGVK